LLILGDHTDVEVCYVKFKRIGNRYDIRTFLKIKHNLRSSFMKSRMERDPQQTAQCVCSIPCECGGSYIGETGRPLAVRLREHSHILTEGLLEKYKLGKCAHEEGHRVGWDEGKILEIESNSRCRKYQESAPYGMFNQSNQPTKFENFSHLEIEISNSQRRSV
jgi:hypothetical protein